MCTGNCSLRWLESDQDFDKFARIDQDTFGSSALTPDTLYRMWEKYPKGILAFEHGGEIVGGLSIWALSKAFMQELRSGKAKESDIDHNHVAKENEAYLAGIEIIPALRGTKEAKHFLTNSLPMWAEHSELYHPIIVSALAYSNAGFTTLSRWGFRVIVEPEKMADKMPLMELVIPK